MRRSARARPASVEAGLRSWPELLPDDETVSSLLIETVDHGDVVVMGLSGELDIYTAPTFQRELEPHERPGALPLVVDLSRVGFLDSSGLGALCSLRNRLGRAGARLGLVGPRRLEGILRAAGLESAFILGEDLADVRAALVARAAEVPRRPAQSSRAGHPTQVAWATPGLSGEGSSG